MKFDEVIEMINEGHYDFKKLRKNQVPLTDEERKLVMDRGAVWHGGPNGEETAAVWKAKYKNGFKYICNTHRAAAIKDSLKAAINSYRFIKTTA